jgi:hypothetical protein
MATDLTDEQIAGCLRTTMPRTKCSSGYLAFARAVLALAAQQPVQEGADCDQAFEEHYKCSARDPSNAGDLAIWRAAWAAKGGDALAAIKDARVQALEPMSSAELCEEFETLSKRVQWNTLSAVNAAWHGFKYAVRFNERRRMGEEAGRES